MFKCDEQQIKKGKQHRRHPSVPGELVNWINTHTLMKKKNNKIWSNYLIYFAVFYQLVVIQLIVMMIVANRYRIWSINNIQMVLQNQLLVVASLLTYFFEVFLTKIICSAVMFFALASAKIKLIQKLTKKSCGMLLTLN